jgi:hypothetical protein
LPEKAPVGYNNACPASAPLAGFEVSPEAVKRASGIFVARFGSQVQRTNLSLAPEVAVLQPLVKGENRNVLSNREASY